MILSYLLFRRKLRQWKLRMRPISLVGGVYKIISKVLVNKLKSVFEKIVLSSQNAFWWRMNVWIVGFALGSREYYANWIWRRPMTMSTGSFYYIC